MTVALVSQNQHWHDALMFRRRAFHVVHPLNDGGVLAIALLDFDQSSLDIDRNVACLEVLLAC